MKLTAHQQVVADNIINKILENTPQVITLSGRAGTGKTTVLKHILTKVASTVELKSKVLNSNSPLTIDCIAPTRASTAILKKAVGNHLENSSNTILHFSTVYSFLQNKTHTVKRSTGIAVSSVYTTIPTSNIAAQPIRYSEQLQLIVIDEISLLSPEDRKVLDMVYAANAIFLLVGDISQTNLNFTGVISKQYLVPRYTEQLTEPLRQSENSHIYRLSEYFRQAIDRQKFTLKPKEFVGSTELRTLSSWNSLTRKFSNNAKDFLYLSWTNQALSTAYQLLLQNNKHNKDFLDTCLRVLTTPIKLHKRVYYKGTLLYLNDMSVCIHNEDKNESIYLDADTLEQVRKYSVLAPFKTIHSAQGATVKEVVIDTADLSKIGDNSDLARLYYTAISRATDKVYFTNMGSLKQAIRRVKS